MEEVKIWDRVMEGRWREGLEGEEGGETDIEHK